MYCLFVSLQIRVKCSFPTYIGFFIYKLHCLSPSQRIWMSSQICKEIEGLGVEGWINRVFSSLIRHYLISSPLATIIEMSINGAGVVEIAQDYCCCITCQSHLFSFLSYTAQRSFCLFLCPLDLPTLLYS